MASPLEDSSIWSKIEDYIADQLNKKFIRAEERFLLLVYQSLAEEDQDYLLRYLTQNNYDSELFKELLQTQIKVVLKTHVNTLENNRNLSESNERPKCLARTANGRQCSRLRVNDEAIGTTASTTSTGTSSTTIASASASSPTTCTANTTTASTNTSASSATTASTNNSLQTSNDLPFCQAHLNHRPYGRVDQLLDQPYFNLRKRRGRRTKEPRNLDLTQLDMNHYVACRRLDLNDGQICLLDQNNLIYSFDQRCQILGQIRGNLIYWFRGATV